MVSACALKEPAILRDGPPSASSYPRKVSEPRVGHRPAYTQKVSSPAKAGAQQDVQHTRNYPWTPAVAGEDKPRSRQTSAAL
jgi:hypothetical protein